MSLRETQGTESSKRPDATAPVERGPNLLDLYKPVNEPANRQPIDKSVQNQDPSSRAEQHIIDSLKHDPKDMSAISRELNDLRNCETPAKFKQDLSKINEDLQKGGILPGLQIFEDKSNKDGFSVKPQDKAEVPNKSNELPPKKTPAPDAAPESAPKPQPGDQHHTKPGDHHKPHHEKHHSSHHHGRQHHGRHHHGRHHHGHHHHSRHHKPGKHHDKGQDKPGKKFEDGAYDDIKKPDEATFENSVKTVLAEAKAQGLSKDATRAALGSMLVESQGNPKAVGDHGTSFGLFQLHKGGELTEALKHGTLKSADEAMDPAKNAHVALAYFKKLEDKYHDPGALAAAAQRPKHRGEYKDKVDSLMPQVDALMKKYGS